MPTVVITGSAGLVGSEAVDFYARDHHIVGIDNDLRSSFFGPAASTASRRETLIQQHGSRYEHYGIDIRDRRAVDRLFAAHNSDITLVIHTAAQPSHDWAARDPLTDFEVNASGTLNLLEATRSHAPTASFVFTSTNKVYGDRPNSLPLEELETRWEMREENALHPGIDESMSIDQTVHSLFGASKTAADLLVQEYGRYFGMKTSVFRGGCLTGPSHAGTELHGFLAYLVNCVVEGKPYRIYGYGGKQVRDSIHSRDLVAAFDCVYKEPRVAEVYNIGGSRHSHCSLLEAIAITERITGRRLNRQYIDQPRRGDHVWYVSDIRKFRSHYPEWDFTTTLDQTIEEIARACEHRLTTRAT